jgi:FkbM family methyltransferase
MRHPVRSGLRGTDSGSLETRSWRRRRSSPGEGLHYRRAGTGDRFVDIGANLGFYAAARANGKRVVAIEPSRDNVEGLLFNLGANGWLDVEVVPMGLRSALAWHRFTEARPRRCWHHGTARPPNPPGWCHSPHSTHSSEPGSRESLLIKMDVEGAELCVLNGASALLARTPKPVWLLEYV